MKSCDIGLISWHYYSNVGSNLQAYALARKINDMGYSCEYINYRKNTPKDSFIRHILKEIYSRIDAIVPNIIPPRLRLQSYRFVRDYIPQTGLIRKEKLKTLRGRYKMYMCGSDQIWASNVLDEVYLLSFAEDDTPKFSYASSVGLPNIPADKKDLYLRNLKRFDKITVREKQGADLLGQLLGENIEWVLDPTLLLSADEWRQIARYYSVPEEKYIFCYLLGENPYHRKWIDDIAEKNGLRVICISHNNEDRKRGWYVNQYIGPREFLGYIDRAALIMTDSFHGMVLSINFKKNFYVMERFKNDDAICQNSRIHNIAAALKLENRIINDYVSSITDIDYNKVDCYLEKEKERSVKALSDMLNRGCNKGV